MGPLILLACADPLSSRVVGTFDSGGPGPDFEETDAPIDTGDSDVEPEPLPLCFNELMPQNHNAWFDSAGVAHDWIELHNPTDADVDLLGWTLTDDEDVPDKVTVTDSSVVPAGGFLLLWADALGEGTLPFSLSSDGGEVGMWAPDGRYSIVSYGNVEEDWAVARATDCGPDWEFVWHGTPGVSNTLEPFTLMERGGEWMYWDGEYPGEGWEALAFDDRAWEIGNAPFGYGEGTETTTVQQTSETVWFRTHVWGEDTAGIAYLTVQLHRDDAAVVYVNGIEVVRSNLDEGTVTSHSLAHIEAFGDQENAWWSYDVDPGLFSDGDNVVAVEVHQATTGAEDMVFDLGIVGERAK